MKYSPFTHLCLCLRENSEFKHYFHVHLRSRFESRSYKRCNQLKFHFAGIAKKLEALNGGSTSEQVHQIIISRPSYKQRRCCFRLKFDASGTVTLKLSPNGIQIAPGLLPSPIWSCKSYERKKLIVLEIVTKLKLVYKFPVQMGPRTA